VELPGKFGVDNRTRLRVISEQTNKHTYIHTKNYLLEDRSAFSVIFRPIHMRERPTIAIGGSRNLSVALLHATSLCKNGLTDRGTFWMKSTGSPKHCVERESISPTARKGGFDATFVHLLWPLVSYIAAVTMTLNQLPKYYNNVLSTVSLKRRE